MKNRNFNGFSTPVGHGNLWVVDLRVVLGWAGFVLDDVWCRFSALPSSECVNVDECPVQNMAMWIHHLLTKVQQMKLMRSIFRCCA